ncbi:hypothetical protein QIS99_27380 [Streptomyces sp. B-S-A8]|uniref:DUF2993 domain-containing protein n=1 Tax=Streptomyces solicavernae TaxID=3043614 RepID=A0ABT6RZL4_9ACTN|nr:hypothetical protein [Streptomyces sp. B-S-A8]MDI3389885.1 hypothetical protein [Streptomyces sp. B-S-A8]
MNIRFATAVAAAAGAVLLTVAPAATAAAPAGPAAAASTAQAAVPLQAEFPVAVTGVEMNLNGQTHTLNLTGKASLTIEAPTFGDLETKVAGTLTVTAEDPDLGKIVVESKGVGTASFNSLLQPFPAKLELSATGNVTIQKDGMDPVTLSTKAAVQLGGEINQFPPRGDLLDLQSPAELVDANGETVGTVTEFPLTALPS